jgi:hypothetical protein
VLSDGICLARRKDAIFLQFSKGAIEMAMIFKRELNIYGFPDLMDARFQDLGLVQRSFKRFIVVKRMQRKSELDLTFYIYWSCQNLNIEISVLF